VDKSQLGFYYAWNTSEGQAMYVSIPSFEVVHGWLKGIGGMFKKLRAIWNTPIIVARLQDPNPVAGAYLLEVRIIRGRAAIPRVFLDDVTDGQDKFLGIVTSPVEVYQADTLELTRLGRKGSALFAILIADYRDADGPQLFMPTVITQRQNGQEKRVLSAFPIQPPVPLLRQKELRLKFRVVLYATQNPTEEETAENFRFSVVPLTDAGKYQVQRIGRKRYSTFGD
jgi:hypothetical protein